MTCSPRPGHQLPEPTAASASATTFRTRGAHDLVITRDLPAPAELVFAALTQAAHLRIWLGRTGWVMTVCISDPRPGGVRRIVWENSDGIEMGIRGTYQTVDRPAGFVCTERFDGAPYSTLNTLRLIERDGHTTMTSVIRYPTADARDAALASNMRSGLDEGLTRLGHLLCHLSHSVIQ